MAEEKILISIIIPCLNEEKYIEKCVRSLLNQKNVGGGYEILIVDGISTDSTRSILQKLSNESGIIRVIDNVKKITPVAFNLGIKNARGEYICIMGAHSEYDENYLANCMKLFSQHPEVSCVGGPIESKGRTSFGKATALAMSSHIGVGNAKHRFSDYEGYAEMACFPMFKKSVFDQIGYYDETLIRNQDDEFCFRLRLNGGKIYISPVIKAEYYVRDSPAKLFKQYFDYGFWRIAVLKKHKLPIALRQFVPALFFISVLVLFIIAFVAKNILLGLFLPVFYILIISIFSLIISSKHGLAVGASFLFSVIILHFSYAAGFLKGLFNLKKKH